MSKLRPGRYRRILIPVVTAVLLACASTPPSSYSLDEARVFYQQVASDAVAARSAPTELHLAREALAQAESALKAGEDAAVVERYAYLARRHSAEAMQAGQIASAEQAVSDSRAQRDRMLADTRLREAQASRAQALQAAQAQTAPKTAEENMRAAPSAGVTKTQWQTQQTERGLVLTLADVLFDRGHARVKQSAMHAIDQLADFLRQYPERGVTVQGYTDSVGSVRFNLRLSQRRADALRSALISRGIDATRILARGFGEASAVASNATLAGRERNRRIEIVISNLK